MRAEALDAAFAERAAGDRCGAFHDAPRRTVLGDFAIERCQQLVVIDVGLPRRSEQRALIVANWAMFLLDAEGRLAGFGKAKLNITLAAGPMFVIEHLRIEQAE